MLGNRYLKNIVVMVGGSAFGSLFSLAIIPIISRIFDSSAFGIAALFLALANLIGNLAPFRYDKALIQARTQEEADHLLNASFICTLLFFIICYSLLGLNFVAPFIPFEKNLGSWLYLVPLAFVIIALSFILDSWLIRESRYKRIAASQSIDPVGVGITRLALGVVYGSSVWALVCGIFVGSLLKVFVLAWVSWGNAVNAIKNFSYPSVIAVMKSYRDFPILNVPAGLANRLANDLPVFVLGAMFAPEIIGFYAMALRILQAPVNVCSNSIRKVYQQRIVNKKHTSQPIFSSYLQTIALCIVLGIFPFGMLYFYGVEIIVIILGEKWHQSGIYAELLIPWIFSIWLTVPTSVVFEVLRKQRIWLVLQILQLVIRASVFYVAHKYTFSAETVLEWFVLACVVGALIVLVLGGLFSYKFDKSLKTSQ